MTDEIKVIKSRDYTNRPDVLHLGHVTLPRMCASLFFPMLFQEAAHVAEKQCSQDCLWTERKETRNENRYAESRSFVGDARLQILQETVEAFCFGGADGDASLW